MIWYKDKDVVGLILKVVALLIFGLFFMYTVKQCSQNYDSPDITKQQIQVDSLLREVAEKELKITKLEIKSNKYIESIDSLKILVEKTKAAKVTVKTKYEKVYVFVDHATNHELDSIIRSNW